MRRLILIIKGGLVNKLYRNKKVFGDYTLGNEIPEYHYYEDILVKKGSIVADIKFSQIYDKFGYNLKSNSHYTKNIIKSNQILKTKYPSD